MPTDSTSSLFISDLHLAADDPASAERAFRFLADTAPNAGALYILGDLFEAWVGDDDLGQSFHAATATALHALSERGVDVWVMHGNRDFLLGEDFCRVTGARLLPDPTTIDLHGIPTLLMHGDSLCTDDLHYQRFRAQMRNPAWQQAVLQRPIAERRLLARQLREQSELAKDEKGLEIMDVNAEAVARAFRDSGCRRLIHGHTHRPGRHRHQVDGRDCERWVLPDWYASGGYLECGSAGCQLHGLDR